MAKKFFEHVEFQVEERGLPFVVKYVKESRNAVMRSLSGQPLASADLVSLDKDGWPKWLYIYKDWTKEESKLRGLMTMLTSLRSIKLGATLDTSTITEPSKYSGFDPKLIEKAVKLLSTGPIRTEWSGWHFSVKGGPLGQALLSSMREATLLPHELIESIYQLGGGKLAHALMELRLAFDTFPDTISGFWDRIFQFKSTSLRALRHFPDKEGKTRVIGILDYWSQSALKELHKSVSRLLKNIKSDCTFDQNKFRELLVNKPIYYSIDLTAATDRMPMDFQYEILCHLIGEAKAKAWKNILVSLGFDTPARNEQVFYRAGQPMGAYSSWPIMAFSHHVMVQISYLLTIPDERRDKVKKPFIDYALLGDDLVIGNSAVGLKYYDVLSILDIDYSPAKTHISERFYEFAKRLILDDCEVTGFSVGGLHSVWKSYPLLSNFLDNQESHGYELFGEGLRVFVSSVHRIMRSKGKFSQEHTNRLLNLMEVFRQLSVDKITGHYMETFKCIHERFGYPLPGLTEEVSVKLFQAARKELAKRDLSKIWQGFIHYENNVQKWVSDYIKGWSDQDPNVLTFLMMTSPAMVKETSPLLCVIQKLCDDFNKAIVSDDYHIVEEYGLAKYFIGKRVFSMKRSDSKIMADAGVVKLLISLAKEANHESIITLHYKSQEGNKVILLE